MAETRDLEALERLRRRIDALDEQLVRLLSARAECALEIGRIKKGAGFDVYQPAREAEVLAHVQRVNAGPLDDGAMKRLFERVIDEARRLERVADGQGGPVAPGDNLEGAVDAPPDNQDDR